ncbi:MAG: 2-polyprenyl-3-methyl-5-hydroxy-6-metoxy-1,4-benzoquinol methylase [Alteromonadaceae bacterium]|jgi:2-polyprenyl-3-methyl-5-hydroxy-6-metoxy-1,4-benzoquinol methylase
MNLLKKLQEEIIKLNPLQASFIKKNLNELTKAELNSFNTYISYCMEIGADIIFLAESYDLIVKDTFKEQVYFKRNKRYRFSKYDEVADSVYNSDEYMKKYMFGLAISAFLWPNHRVMHQYFLAILNDTPSNKEAEYLEIGPGHGFYFMQSMKNTNFSHYTGVDISPTSVELTKSIISSAHFGSYSNYNIIESNFLSWTSEKKFDFIVMAEVLEHVEQPLLFLEKSHEILTNSGTAFITTCINAPAIDHIYLYDSVKHLSSQVSKAGFKIISELVVPYVELSLEETMKQMLPVNIAMYITKK